MLHLIIAPIEAALRPLGWIGRQMAAPFDGRDAGFAVVLAIAAIALCGLAVAPLPADFAAVATPLKLAFGGLGFLVFAAFARGAFDVQNVEDARLAGLRAPAGSARGASALLGPGVFALICIGGAAAFMSVSSGLLATGVVTAWRGGVETLALGPHEWVLVAVWSTFGVFDVLGLAPDYDEALLGLRLDWGPASVWLAIYKIAVVLTAVGRLAGWLEKRRLARIGLSEAAPMAGAAQEAHLARLGRAGSDALLLELRTAPPSRRATAATLLGRLAAEPERATRALVRTLDDRAPEVRAAAARALGALGVGARGAAPALIRALEDADDSVHIAAAAALGAVEADDPVAVAALVSALDGAGPTAVSVILDSLTRVAVGDRRAIDRVDQLRSHHDDDVRRKVTDTLTLLRGGAAVAA